MRKPLVSCLIRVSPEKRHSSFERITARLIVLVVCFGLATGLFVVPNHAASPLLLAPPAPTIGNYAPTSIALSGDTTVTPDAPPTGAASAIATTTADFKGKLETDPTTGVVRITNAHPAGSYTVTVTVFDGAGGSASTTFTLTVTTPAGCTQFLGNAFSAPVNLTTGASSFPISVAVGDFNGDGKQDLVSANQLAGTVSVFLRNAGNTGFDPKVDLTVGHQPFSVAVGDFNGDGKQDIVTANQTDNNVSVFLGDGTGGFGAPVDFPVGTGPSVVAVGDFNSDDRLDIVTSDNDNNTGTSVSVLLRNALNTGFDRTDFTVGTSPYGVAVGDFNGDGQPDIVTANTGSSDVSVLLGDGTGGFASEAAAPYAAAPLGSAFAVVAGDFNGDGKQDIAVANVGTGNVSILLRNTTNDGFDTHLEYATGTGPRGIAVGDFNNDGKQDLATANFGSGNVSVLLENGSGAFDSPINFPSGSQAFTIAVGDFNGDNRQDLATADRGADQISVLIRDCSAPSAANATISGRITDDNGAPIGGVTIDLSGTQSRQTITDSYGEYSLGEVETNGFYTVTPSRANYSFTPPNRSFSLLGDHTEASFTASANGDRANAIDTTEFFVRQQYLDFLGREPDPPGFVGWVNTIKNCAPNDASCDRVHVSEMFFRSQEFQNRGYLVYRFYSSAFGRKPGLAEFTPDLGRVSGFLTNDQLEAAKNSLVNDFVMRPEFASRYNSLSNTAYVDQLMSTAGVSLTNRQVLLDSLNNQTATRAQVLRQIADSGEVYQRYYNQAFVVMEYFGYLRRDPDALYTSWISVLDANPADSRHMVEGFVNSMEYRNRFSQ